MEPCQHVADCFSAVSGIRRHPIVILAVDEAVVVVIILFAEFLDDTVRDLVFDEILPSQSKWNDGPLPQ